MLSPETILQGRYRIIRQLGQGGMGAVYEAVDSRLDTTVALKETLFTEEKLRKQFEREARLLARLHHQALPRVSDHFNEGDGQFLVMQYIAGEDLAEMLAQQNRPFPPEEVLRWGDQLCDALDYLHTQDPQIIHRDIKPQNLKLTARGQVVLLDFGLAKGSVGQLTAVTTSASIFGYTPNYAPLEQVQGLGTDARSDIYSLAATLYHLITNVKPPDALSRAGAVVNGNPDPLLPANHAVPLVTRAVADVLGRGMSQKRDDRFATATLMRKALRTASSVAADLGDAATVLASSATVGGATDKSTKLMGEQTQAVGSEAQTLLATDATRVRSAVVGPEPATVVRPQPAARSSRKGLAAAALLLLVAGGTGAFFVYRSRQNRGQSVAPVSASPTPTSQSEAKASPSTSPTQASTSKNEPKNEKTRSESANQRTATTKGTTEKTTENTNRTTQQTGNNETAEHNGERNRDRNRQSPSGVPPTFDPGRNAPGRQPSPQRSDIPTVRTFPNGSKMVIQPDGTRILTMPNGATRVIPPNEKLNRKRNRIP